MGGIWRIAGDHLGNEFLPSIHAIMDAWRYVTKVNAKVVDTKISSTKDILFLNIPTKERYFYCLGTLVSSLI